MGSRQRKRGAEPENLYERNGIWYARAQINGRERRRSLKTRSRREAERRLSAWLKENSPYHGTVRATFKEAATLWLEASNWKPKTARGYVKLLRLILAHFGNHYWDQVDKAALLAFIEARKRSGSGIATINRYLTVVSGIAKHVRELPGWPEINPVEMLAKKPRKPTKWRYVRPPAEDVEAIFARMHGTFGDLCAVALEIGARKDELVLLERDNARGGKATFVDTKSRAPRTITLTPKAREIIERQPVLEGSPYVFNTRNGGPYKRATEMFREVVGRAQKAAQKAGRRFTRMRFHDLRHEMAIRYLEAGHSIYRLQKILGHSTIKQTEEYLIYLTPEQAALVQSETAQ
jgi:integrase/recombinase XerD